MLPDLTLETWGGGLQLGFLELLPLPAVCHTHTPKYHHTQTSQCEKKVVEFMKVFHCLTLLQHLGPEGSSVDTEDSHIPVISQSGQNVFFQDDISSHLLGPCEDSQIYHSRILFKHSFFPAKWGCLFKNS